MQKYLTTVLHVSSMKVSNFLHVERRKQRNNVENYIGDTSFTVIVSSFTSGLKTVATHTYKSLVQFLPSDGIKHTVR